MTRPAPLRLALFFLAWCLWLLGAGGAAAAPLFTDPLLVAGERVYRDHSQARLFYLVPASFALQEKNGVPVFRFALIGYLGSARTQDQGSFQDKGVLAFTVEEEKKPALFEKVRAVLQARHGSAAVLKSMPVADVAARLIYERVGAQPASGSLAMRSGEEEDKKKGQLWQQRVFVLALDDLDSNFFWKAFQEDLLALSLSYSISVDGFRNEEGQMVQAKEEFSGALPIRVSPKKFPALFEQIDLGARLTVGYTHLDVFCFDFVNEEAGDTYSKIVEIRYRDLRGKPVLTQLRFDAGSLEYRRGLDFQYAKALVQGYDYRITEVSKAGEVRVGEWVRDNADSFLDVSRPAAERTPADAVEEKRMLY